MNPLVDCPHSNMTPIPPIQRPDLAAIKARQQQTWATGDYGVVGSLVVISAENLCEAVDVRPNERVLDVATGHGNTALAAARRFGKVVGVDYVPALLERARVRAAAEGLPVEFKDGDAEALPFADASFDVVLSTFGSMFAPDHERTAGEMARVCRPGGRIGLVSWTPDSHIARMFQLTSRFVPPPAGLTPPVKWGDEAHLKAIFGSSIRSLESRRREIVFRFASFEHWMAVMGTFYGPVVRALAALEPAKRKELEQAIAEQQRAESRAKDCLIIPSTYLETVLTRA